MEKQLLLVMKQDGKVTLTLELGAITVNVPNVRLADAHNHVAVGKDRVPFGRFLRPGIFSAAGFATVIGLLRLFH